MNKATAGQHAGIKISGFKAAMKGDLIESFEELPPRVKRWHPDGTVHDFRK